MFLPVLSATVLRWVTGSVVLNVRNAADRAKPHQIKIVWTGSIKVDFELAGYFGQLQRNSPLNATGRRDSRFICMAIVYVDQVDEGCKQINSVRNKNVVNVVEPALPTHRNYSVKFIAV